jgi:hypothetical protein
MDAGLLFAVVLVMAIVAACVSAVLVLIEVLAARRDHRRPRSKPTT